MARFFQKGTWSVAGVGDGGEAVGPFKADKDGVVEVPDEFLEALRVLRSARGVVELNDEPEDLQPQRSRVKES